MNLVRDIKNKPFFSIIIPTLNEEKYLPFLLEDLNNQVYNNFEIIHVDGNSDDKTIEIAKKFTNVKSIITKKRNVCFQKNLGARKANGKWLVFIDADIQIEKNYLNKIRSILLNNKVDILWTFYKPDTNKLSHIMFSFLGNWISYFFQFSKQPLINEAVYIFNKKKFLKLGGFNINLKVSEGADIIKRSKKMGFVLRHTIYPKYTYSMRRIKQQGFFNTITNNTIIVFKMLLGKKMTKENLKNLYPMEGGAQYSKNNN